MTDLLFAAPWWLIGILFVVGGVIGWSGLTKEQAGPRNAGLGLILLAIVLLLLGIFFETDKEQVTRKSKELVTAVEKADWQKMTDLLDPDASLNTPTSSLFPNRSELVKGARAAAETYRLRSVTITGMDVKQDSLGCVVDLRVLTNADASPYPTPSTWEFNWDKTGTQWHVHQITCIEIANERSDAIGRWLHVR
jgi:hypothetical protein